MRGKGTARLSRRRRVDFRWVDHLHSVFIKGTNKLTEIGNLCNIFSRFLKVIDVHLLRREGKARDFAFVRFRHIEELQRVIKSSNKFRVNGRRMLVVLANLRNANHQSSRLHRNEGFERSLPGRNHASCKDVVMS